VLNGNLESTAKLSQEAEFQFKTAETLRGSLSSLSLLVQSCNFRGSARGKHRILHDSTPDMVSEIISNFKQQSDRLKVDSLPVKFYHPKLSIAIYDSEHLQTTQQSQPLRVLESKNSFPLKEGSILGILRRLLKALDAFHIQVLRILLDLHTGIAKDVNIRKDLLEWLIQGIIKPTGSLPIHGLVQIKDDRSPWADLSEEDSLELFGPVQRKLIEYFSKGEKRMFAKREELIYFLATWYTYYHPTKLEFLMKYAKIKDTKDLQNGFFL
jgi:hypothetical protein